MLGNLAKQGGVEAIEESGTEITNLLTNAAIMGQQSDWNKLVEDAGGDEHKAWIEVFRRVANAGIGGFISGGFMGAGPSIVGYGANRAQDTAVGKEIVDRGGSDALMNLALEMAESASQKEAAALRGAQEALARSITPDAYGNIDTRQAARSAGRLQRTIRQTVTAQNTADISAGLQEQGFTKRKANQIADALAASLEGRELTDDQHEILLKWGKDERVTKVTESILGDGNSNSVQRLSALETSLHAPQLYTRMRDVKQAIADGRIKEESPGANAQEIETSYDVSSDGKTVYKDNEVQIVSIDSVEGGKLYLKLDDGSVVDSSDVSFSSADEALVYETVANMNISAADANALVEAFRAGDVSANTFALGIQDAVTYGTYGMEYDLANSESTSALTEQQRKTAYQIGQRIGSEKTSAKRTRGARKAKPAKGYKNVSFVGTISRMGSKRKADLKFLDFIASEFSGNNVYVFESYVQNGKRVYKDTNGFVKDAPNGMYMANGDIYIDLNAGMEGEGFVLNTFAHELTHHIRDWSPTKFKALADFLVKEYGKAGQSVDELVHARMARSNLNYDAAFEEVVADSMEKMFTDGNIMDKLTKLKAQDKGLLQRIKNFIDKWLSKIKEFYSAEGQYVTREGELAHQLERFEQLQQLFAEALVDAGENYQKAEKSATDKGVVKYQARSNWNGVTQAEIDMIQNIGKISVSAFSSANINTVKRYAEQYWSLMGVKSPFFRAWFGDWRANDGSPILIAKTQGVTKNIPHKNNDTGWEITISGKIFDENKTHKSVANREARPYMPYLDSIVKNAVLLDTRGADPKSPNTLLMHHMYAVADVGNGPEVLKLYVEEMNNPISITTGKRAYNLQNIEKAFNTRKRVRGNAPSPSANVLNAINTVADLFTAVKVYDSSFSPNPSSKVTNADGTPKVMYHGTRAENGDFWEFDASKAVKKGGLGLKALGKGNYFTAKKLDGTERYGSRVIPAYLDIKTPYVYNGGRSFLEDVSKAMGLDPQKQDYDTLQQEMRNRGYDGVIQYDSKGEVSLAVAFDSTQIKSATDNIGTFDGGNPDIRYSDRTGESISNRSLLANAFESMAQNDIERQKIAEYKSKIETKEAEERKLRDLKEQIKELSFAKGPRDTAKLKSLREEAIKTANRLSIYDGQLLRLEASKPLQNVLLREKKKAYDRAKAEGKQAKLAAMEGRNKTAMRHKIQNVVGELNRLLLTNDKKRHVPDNLKKAVADALSLVNMDTVGAEERAAKYADLIAKETDPDKIDAYTVTMENLLRQGEKMGQRLKELRDAYEEIQNSDDPDIANAYDPVIAGSLNELSQSIGNTSLRNMSLAQLQDVYDMYRMVLTRVRDANKSLIDSIKESITERASKVIGEVRKAGGAHTHRASALDPVKKFSWDNLKPVYAMERIGSSTLTEAYNNVRAGEDTWAKDVVEAREYYLDKSKKYGYDSWDFEKKYTFESTSGVKFELTLEQIMALYAYSKRDQAGDHLRLGGFVFDSNIETHKETVEEKDGKIKRKKSILKYKVNTADAHQISVDILADITGSLTKDQRAFVDEMQDYLSTVMGAKGNEVTMKMYGVKLFKEKFYFPLKSAKQFMFEQNEVAGEVRIKNSGFTNKTKPNANNPIILNNFMDVWANHVNDMSMYHSFVLPLEDFNRIFNYNSPKAEGSASVSVKGTIQNAYDPAAVSYVKQLITDLNGGAVSDPRETVGKSLLAKFKKAKVFSSLSVVIQQPSAIGRAFALIHPKYFKPTKDGMNHAALWDELKKYAPVAIIKEMGYFDTNMGKSTQDFITGKEYSGLKEKAKAIFTDGDYRDEVLSKAPALADELAWCAIWNAVKRETVSTHKNLRPGSEAFLKAAGERFTEVITKTQVYDSVLARSANMRSKSGMMSMVTSFMAEPTTTINMIEDALIKAKKGNRGYAARVFASVAVSILLNNALVAIVYAMRDDDEDETFAEKYAQALVSGLLDDANPLTYYPYLKDMWSLFQGYDIERSDMSLVSDLADAAKRLVTAYSTEDGDLATAWWDIAGSVANLGGIPVNNIRRDVKGAINLFDTLAKDMSGRSTTWMSLGDVLGETVRKSLPVVGWLPGDSKADNLYDAIIKGDTVYVNRLKGSYKDESAYNSAVRKALRENDPRIRQAAEAEINGDPAERVRIARLIIADGFGQDNVVAAINAEINAINSKKDDEPATKKVSGLYDATDFAVEIGNGNKTSANAAREDIIQTAMANGKTKAEAEASFESSAKTALKEEFLAGGVSSTQALNALTTYCGDSKKDAERRIKEWEFEDEHGFSYSECKQQFLDGNISESEVKSTIMSVEGKTADEAAESIADWEFEGEYGFAYDDKKQQYLDGNISENEMRTILMDVGGKTAEEADLQIEAYDWVAQGYEGATPAAVRDYHEYCEQANVPKDTYLHIRSFANNTENDKDENGNSINYSAMKKIMAEIDAQPGLTAAQKTAIAKSLGWKDSSINRFKPW